MFLLQKGGGTKRPGKAIMFIKPCINSRTPRTRTGEVNRKKTNHEEACPPANLLYSPWTVHRGTKQIREEEEFNEHETS